MILKFKFLFIQLLNLNRHVSIYNRSVHPSCPSHRDAVWKSGSGVHAQVKAVGTTESHVCTCVCAYVHVYIYEGTNQNFPNQLRSESLLLSKHYPAENFNWTFLIEHHLL